MTKKFRKSIFKITTLLVIFSMTLVIVPTTNAASKLTNAKDILSRAKVSGTGSAVSGYTQSTQEVTDDFIIVNTENDVVCIDTAGGTASSTCDGSGDVKVDLITHGGLTTGSHYTG
ncbi:MAG: hypothetical protein ABH818_01750, partial [Patescibacteria group bacterium]